MSKYANHLFEKGHSDLVRNNVKYFKDLAKHDKKYNNTRNYRIVENEGLIYLRGITSEKQYFEYGVDFAFVSSMLILHQNMKVKSIGYKIKSAFLNESKLNIIVVEKKQNKVEGFGNVSQAIEISTNDLGTGSLNFSNIINIQDFFLYPGRKKRNENVEWKKFPITHTTKPINVLKKLSDMKDFLNTSNEFIKELKAANNIKNPDQLRHRIYEIVTNKNSLFKDIKDVSDLFKRKIDNKISAFAKLLEMCNKAELLDIRYDLKEKLRYIISDIILYGNTK